MRLLRPCFLLLLSAFPAYAQVEVGPVSRLGDNELTCRQLFDQVKQLDIIAANAKARAEANEKAAQSAAQAAHQAAGIGTFLSFLPFFGSITSTAALGAAQVASGAANVAGGVAAGTASSNIQSNMQEAAKSRMAASQATAREQYLTSLFNSKGCKLSEIEGKQPEAVSPNKLSSTDKPSPSDVKNAPDKSSGLDGKHPDASSPIESSIVDKPSPPIVKEETHVTPAPVSPPAAAY